MAIFKRQNLIQMYTNTHQIVSFKKFSGGGMPPNPPNKAHGEATCIFPNLKKKILAHLLPSPDATIINYLNDKERGRYYFFVEI